MVLEVVNYLQCLWPQVKNNGCNEPRSVIGKMSDSHGDRRENLTGYYFAVNIGCNSDGKYSCIASGINTLPKIFLMEYYTL